MHLKPILNINRFGNEPGSDTEPERASKAGTDFYTCVVVLGAHGVRRVLAMASEPFFIFGHRSEKREHESDHGAAKRGIAAVDQGQTEWPLPVAIVDHDPGADEEETNPKA